MSRRELKARLVEILDKGWFDGFWEMVARYPAHALLAPLFSSLCHPLPRVRGNAVRAFGILVPRMAETDMEAARIVMRRFLWSLNEESGGIGWGAPEAMAAILGASPLLRREYLHLLCSYMRGDGPELFQDGNHLELPLLQRGLLAGIGDLCRDHRQEMVAQDIADDLRAYLASPDYQVVGLAIRCLGFLQETAAAEDIAGFLDHPGRVDVFAAGEEKTMSVGELAADSLAMIAAGANGGDAFSPPSLSHLGFVQFEVVPGNPSANLARLTAKLQQLQPPPRSLLLLPELWGTGFTYGRLGQLLPEVEQLLKEVQRLAAQFDILLAGSLPEAVPGGTLFFNTLWLVGAEGVIGRVRKTHLFPGEEIAFVPSTEVPSPLHTPMGNVGAMICYDLRFPDIARRQTMQGADCLICAAQWPAARLSHLHALAVARAIENQTYVAVCNGVGKNGEVPLGGGSVIVAPDGKILALAGNRPQAEVVKVDWQLVQEARSVFRSFSVDPMPARVRDKLVDITTCRQRLAARRRAGQRLVYCRCDGMDDTKTIPVALLETARSHGDYLVVAVGDSIAVGDRLLLAALACVDMVVEGPISKEEEAWFGRNCRVEPLSAEAGG